MKASTSQKVKLGLFTALGLAVLFVFVFVIGSQKNMFSKKINLYGQFSNVTGLKTGGFVRFAGINVGTVDQISIVNDTTVRVDLSVERDVQKFLKKDSRMSIGSDGLMGDKLVTLSPGSEGQPMIEDGDEIPVVNPMQMDQVMEKFGAITDDAGIVIANLADISDRVNAGEGSLGRLLSSDRLARNMEQTIQQTGETVDEIKRAAAGFGDNMEAAQESFLLRGAIRRKERKEKREAEQAAKEAQKKTEEQKQKTDQKN